ncbi:MAG: hypothetical protein HY758_06055 [Nitrospirae bacterium]|nr:hypothetical protein [Nitrospirota bacterium]
MRSLACPYAQTIPYITNAAFKENSVKMLRPVINFEAGTGKILKEIHKSLRPFRISLSSIKKAYIQAEKAQEEFISAIKLRGRKLLSAINKKTIVIVGRAYNSFDPGVNLEIPRKLSDLGVFSFPMDYLPMEIIDITGTWPNMYWRSGQNLLRAAEIIRDNPNLFALYIGNFSCGPDSFIHRFFKETMGAKPFLQIEIDEHSADAGVVTRCEAFLDSIEQRDSSSHSGSERREKVLQPRRTKASSLAKRIVYIPRMSDHTFGIASAFESCGVDAEVMGAPDTETVKIGRRFVSGKECYPFLITTGDMVKKVFSQNFEPERTAFFMPSGSGPCRFGQYNVFHRLVLDKIGLSEVPIFSPNQDASLYKELGIVGDDFARHAWRGIIATEILIKCLHETRPYENNKGETDEIYKEYLFKVSRMVKSRNGALDELMREICRSFAGIPKTGGRKPLIGLVGEIFVRHNSFSNENVIRKIEELGGEVWLSPFGEWISYLNLVSLRRAVTKWQTNLFSHDNIQNILSVLLTRFVQKKVEHKFAKPFKGFLRTLGEPSTEHLLNQASPYLDDSFEGEAVLSIGKSVDYVKNSASGIISVMPFGCMPGTIVNALLKGLKQDYGIPCLSIAYDGSESTCSDIQIEAFMHQAKEYNIQYTENSRQ